MSSKKTGIIHKTIQVAGMMANGSLLTLGIMRQDVFGIILGTVLAIGWLAMGIMEVIHEV